METNRLEWVANQAEGWVHNAGLVPGAREGLRPGVTESHLMERGEGVCTVLLELRRCILKLERIMSEFRKSGHTKNFRH